MFDDFDDEHGQNILDSLHLEAEEEPVRRGASRANSVRFDVSAIHGANWAQGSRSSGEFAPTRPSSGLGGHPIERSLSHKSDGRHSSTGFSIHSTHSVPSGRTSSLGLDTNFAIDTQEDDSPIDIPHPPPGLFVLGSVPSIIRCWLSTNFSHNALLYAVVCSGSKRSLLDYALVKKLGLEDSIQGDSSSSSCNIKLPVYLPEAIITQPTSRSNSPATQLPSLIVEFELFNITQRPPKSSGKVISVFLGSDTLRAHNADILFSQNAMTLYSDDRKRLSVPFVRPEDEKMFKNLYTRNFESERNETNASSHQVLTSKEKGSSNSAANDFGNKDNVRDGHNQHHIVAPSETDPVGDPGGSSPTKAYSSIKFDSSDHKSSSISDTNIEDNSMAGSNKPSLTGTELKTHNMLNSASPNMPEERTRRDSSTGGVWGSWRQTSLSVNGSESGRESESTSGYQKPIRSGRSMKVLKSSKSGSATGSNRAASGVHTGASYEPPPARLPGESRRKSQGSATDNTFSRWETKKEGLEDPQATRPPATLPKSSNPIGGASAFSWMNPGKSKIPATMAE